MVPAYDGCMNLPATFVASFAYLLSPALTATLFRDIEDLLPDDKLTNILFGALVGASLFLVHAWRLYLSFKRERVWRGRTDDPTEPGTLTDQDPTPPPHYRPKLVNPSHPRSNFWKRDSTS